MIRLSRGLAGLCLLAGAVCGPSFVLAQSESDRQILDKARSAYLSGPVPSTIACSVALDWEGFLKRANLEQTAENKARLDALKSTKISVASRDGGLTEVKIEAEGGANEQISDGLRQQLQGFFQIFWAESYGRIFGRREDAFELTAAPEGYVVKMASAGNQGTIEMDKGYLITRVSVAAPQMKAMVVPVFKAGEDRLLRLVGMNETVEMGATKLVINVSLDYQTVNGFEIPQHVSMALPGSFTFDYTLNGCAVSGQAIPAAK